MRKVKFERSHIAMSWTIISDALFVYKIKYDKSESWTMLLKLNKLTNSLKETAIRAGRKSYN